MNKELQDLELFIAKLLRSGVLVAGLLIAVGWLLQISFNENVFANFSNYQPVPLVDSIKIYWQQGVWGKLIAYAGLIILITLPIIRVIATGIIFIKQKNTKFVLLVATVVVGLALSLILGFEI